MNELVIEAFDVLGVTQDRSTAASCSEIWAALEDADKCRFAKGAASVNDVIYKMQSKGLVVQGDSTYGGNNKSVFTWYRSHKWGASRMPVADAAVDPVPADSDISPADSPANSDIPDQMTKIEFEYDGMPVTMFFSAAVAKPAEPIKIDRKTEKLQVLEHFKTFIAPVNQDFAFVLQAIIDDLAGIGGV